MSDIQTDYKAQNSKGTDKRFRISTSKSSRIWHRVLLILCVFISVGAIFGFVIAVVQTTTGSFMGSEAIVPSLQEVPVVGRYIDSLIIPGVALLIFVFAPQVIAGILLLRRHLKQYTAVIIGGILLAVFTIGELVLIPSFLSWVFLFFGIVEICAGVFCLRQRH